MKRLNHTDLTQYEVEALQQEFNFTNAFAQQSQSPSQMDIIRRLPELWLEQGKRILSIRTTQSQ